MQKQLYRFALPYSRNTTKTSPQGQWCRQTAGVMAPFGSGFLLLVACGSEGIVHTGAQVYRQCGPSLVIAIATIVTLGYTMRSDITTVFHGFGV